MDIVPTHGGDIVSFAQQVGCAPDEVIDLSSNINFLKPNMGLDFNQLNIAPYPNDNALREAVARRYGVEVEALELFNGATVAIHVLFRFLNLSQVTLFAPLYGEYQRSAKIHGYGVDCINRLEGIDHKVAPESLVVFVNPSTPDGRYYSLEKQLAIWMKKGCTVLIDESFLEFTPYASATEYLDRYDRLYVLKSMTKFYGAAGVRVGALLSQKKNMVALRAQEPLWKLSTFDSHYIQGALRDRFFPEISRIVTEENRDHLRRILTPFVWVERIYPAKANYLLVKLRYLNAFELQERLMPYRIMIRNCVNFDFLDARFVRIAVKERESINRLEEALCEIFI